MSLAREGVGGIIELIPMGGWASLLQVGQPRLGVRGPGRIIARRKVMGRPSACKTFALLLKNAYPRNGVTAAKRRAIALLAALAKRISVRSYDAPLVVGPLRALVRRMKHTPWVAPGLPLPWKRRRTLHPLRDHVPPCAIGISRACRQSAVRAGTCAV